MDGVASVFLKRSSKYQRRDINGGGGVQQRKHNVGEKENKIGGSSLYLIIVA